MLPRGFISAPLLGTLVFLGAVLIVVHVTQLEKQEVSGIVADIYHNRVTSMLEDYRYDMGSLFAVALSRAIERYLSNECWEVFALKNDNYAEPGGAVGGTATRGVSPAGFPHSTDYNYDNFGWCANTQSNQGDPNPYTCKRAGTPSDLLCVENCNGQLDYYELRYKKCTEISDIIRDGICPYDRDYGLTAWLDATRTPFNFEGVSFSVSNGALVSKFVDQISCTFPNGVATEPKYFKYDLGSNSGECQGYSTGACDANPSLGGRQFECTTSDGHDCGCLEHGRLEVGQGIQNCRKLVGDSLFDCRNFATNLVDPYRCCSEFDSNGNCKAGKVIPGCSNGTFYVGVNVLANDEVYRSLPRVNATDSGGNEIQSGALGDRNFTIHVKYPVYKYLDAAFRSYMPLAYGLCSPNGDDGDFEAPINMQVHGGTGNGRTCPNGHGPQDDLEGIIEGLCYGIGCNGQYYTNIQCRNQAYRLAHPGLCEAEGFDRTFNGTQLSDEEQAAFEQAKARFLNIFLDPQKATSVCRLFDPNNLLPGHQRPLCADFALCNTTVVMRGLGIQDFHQLCPYNLAEWTYIKNNIHPELLFKLSNPDCAQGGANQGRCAAVDSLALTFKFMDKKPETLVNPIANNFCWHMRPVHVNPKNRLD